MNKYENGKIYKLTGSNGLVYYGSTIQPLKGRIYKHKNKYNSTCSKKLTNPKIELVENYPCNCRGELEMRERWFIENNECVNINIARTKEEIDQYNKQYKIDNKEHHKQTDAIYKLKNKETRNKYSKKYYADNKEKTKEYNKQRYEYNASFIGILARGYF